MNFKIFRRKANILAYVHKDKKEIRGISNVHGKKIMLNNKPEALHHYNLYARGVDKSNQQSLYYHYQHKCMKWYKIIIIAILEAAVANAYELFKAKNPFSAVGQLEFREHIV